MRRRCSPMEQNVFYDNFHDGKAKGKRVVNHIYLPSFDVEWNWE